MATEPNYKKINEDKRKAELSKREDELKRLQSSEQQLSRYGDSKMDRILYLRQEIKALRNPDQSISHKALYEMEVSSLKAERTILEKKLGGRYINPSEETNWIKKLNIVNKKIKGIDNQYLYLSEQTPKDEISKGISQLLASGRQKRDYYGNENQKTDKLLTEISKCQGNVLEKLYNRLDNIVTEGQKKLLKDVDQLIDNNFIKTAIPEKSFEKNKTVKNILNNAEKYKKNCVVMVNNFYQQNYVVADALKDYEEKLKGNRMKKPASVDVIKFVSRLQKAVEARQQTSKVEMPDKNDQKKDQTFYQEVPIPSGQGATKDQESFTQASNPSVSGRVSLVSNEFDAKETSTDVVKEAVAVKVPENKGTPTEVKKQEAPSKDSYPRYSTVNGQIVKDETGISKNYKEIFVLNNGISIIKEELGKAITQREVFTDRGKTLIGRIRNFFSKGTIKRLDNRISSYEKELTDKQKKCAQLQNPTDKSKENPQQSFEQVTDRSKEVSKDKSSHKPQAKARTKKEVVTELA